MKRLIVSLVVLLLLAQPAIALPTPEVRLFNLINLYRYENNVKPLQQNSSLTNYASRYVKEMSDSECFTHESPTTGDIHHRLNINLEPGWIFAGENLERASEEPLYVLKNFKLSQEHNKNMLDVDYNSMGTGHCVKQNGVDYWAVEFAKY